jgi:hypothetical protein
MAGKVSAGISLSTVGLVRTGAGWRFRDQLVVMPEPEVMSRDVV